MYVYQYHHIDDPTGIHAPEDVMKSFVHIVSKQDLERAKAAFKEAGWEGDGELGMIWLPPFACGYKHEDTFGIWLVHVKQSNNGTSFLASPIPLPFYESDSLCPMAAEEERRIDRERDRSPRQRWGDGIPF